jgi:hypothetical protein
MRTSRILLRLLLLVGSLILLLDARHRGLATYSAECGYYPPGTAHNCPSPCQLQYYTFTRQQAGPYYISGNQEWCTGDSGLDCTSATGVSSPATPEPSTACGCGATGEWCQDPNQCCGTDLCQDSSCVTCLSDGYGTCESDADCCSGYCDCYGYCGCDSEGDDCCTDADCCGAYVCTDGTCQSSGGGGGGGGSGGCTSNDDCDYNCCDIGSGKCVPCEAIVGAPHSLDRMSHPKPAKPPTVGGRK